MQGFVRVQASASFHGNVSTLYLNELQFDKEATSFAKVMDAVLEQMVAEYPDFNKVVTYVKYHSTKEACDFGFRIVGNAVELER